MKCGGKRIISTLCLALSAAVSALAAADAPSNSVRKVASPISAQLSTALDNYQALSGKTLLCAARLPEFASPIATNLPSEKSKALAQFEAEFATNGIAIIQDGPLFARVVPAERRDAFTNAPLHGAEFQPSQSNQLPAGALTFPAATLEQFLHVYQQLRGRIVLHPARLPMPPLRLKTATALSTEQAVYAMNTVLALADLAVIDDGLKFVQVVSEAERIVVRTKAPKASEDTLLLYPGQSARPATAGTNTLAREQRLLYEFVHGPTARRHTAEQLLALHAELVGKTAVPAGTIGTNPISLDISLPVTRSEFLYAINSALWLNRLVIASDGDSVRLRARARPPTNADAATPKQPEQ